jgi:predicted dienelactone hydrolase
MFSLPCWQNRRKTPFSFIHPMKSTIVICILLFSGCSTPKKIGKSSQNQALKTAFSVKVDSLDLLDKARNRSVPVALYLPDTKKNLPKQQVVVLSHGYGGNRGGDNKAYTYLTEFLASQGYFVASIQHELPTDELLPMTGKPQEVRRPNWERGVQNILFVIEELKRRKLTFDYKHLTLIGHSNGGDMSMLFAHTYPDKVDKVISLDNRRMSFPRTQQPKIFSLRSSDQVADEGVLPTLEEQQKYKMRIIKLVNTIHNDMDDHANAEQRKEINNYILDFLNK